MYMMKENSKHCALKRKRVHPEGTIPRSGNEQNGDKTGLGREEERFTTSGASGSLT
jgi:hypothetical protein